VEQGRAELLPRLTGLRINRVELVSTTLEDVFLQLTGGDHV
jgi:hypothetical protein